MVAITAERWNAARAALRESADRFADLVRATAPTAMATRHWSVADVAAHVTAIALWDTALVRPGDAPHPYPWNELAERIRVTNVDTVDVLNRDTLLRFTERDPQVLAERLGQHVGELLRTAEDADPDRPVRWLGGSRLPVAGLLAHLTNELQVHGRDIARATGSAWVIPPAYAGQFIDLFVVGVTRHGVGGLLYRDAPPGGRRVAVEFRSAHTDPAVLVLAGGKVDIGGPGCPVDVRVRFEPVMLNLMMFGRISRARAALSGKLVVGGRRPWLLPAFLRTVRFPS